MTLRPRAILVHRRSEYEQLLVRHGTRQQASFHLETRGRSIEELAERHRVLQDAIGSVASAIPTDWRRATVERADLHRFDVAAEDVIVVVGQDGLVANVAKYLSGQPVVGIDPEPGRNPGVLVTNGAAAAADLLSDVAAGRAVIERRTMVGAEADDGRRLEALNEVYVGHRTHQSARYRIVAGDGASERQSSSGVLIGAGTGATGWLRSVWQERRSCLDLPTPVDRRLCWFVREAWPSPATGTTMTEGSLGAKASLTLQAESDELVCFGDGIESDSLRLTWGQTLTIGASRRTLDLVVA